MFTATPSSVESSERTLVPLPSACGAKELAAFEFLGRLVGIALRTGATLPLNMPRVVWKRLVRVSSPVYSRFSLSFTHTARTIVPHVVGILTHFLPTTQTHIYAGGAAAGGARFEGCRRRLPRAHQWSGATLVRRGVGSAAVRP